VSSASEVFDLKGRVAVVTGASSGIGLEIANTLADAGVRVVLVARRKDLLEQHCIAIEQRNGKASFAIIDLSDKADFEHAKEKVNDCFGDIQIVVNAAGINLRQPAEQVSWKSWQYTINLNLSVPFFFSRMFVDQMMKGQWGKIVNIASLQSSRAFPNGIAYGASKGGVVQLTRAMSEAWSRFGISCNAIAPGFFPTPLTAPVFENSELAQRMAAQTTMGRNGRLADLHGPVLFLASRATDYVTGQTIYVDGGFTAK